MNKKINKKKNPQNDQKQENRNIQEIYKTGKRNRNIQTGNRNLNNPNGNILQPQHSKRLYVSTSYNYKVIKL